MSPRASDSEAAEAPHPRDAFALHGHAEAEYEMLQAYRGGRMPHAWLIGGSPGIGKATLAYRMARFVLAHPDPAAADVQAAQTLAVAPEHPVARRITAQAHSDLLALERTIGDNGKLRTEIAVADVRRTIAFFGSTAGEGGWRVCIVDSVDELNRFGTNALLKILEEPPARSLLFLLSHAPGQVLPTIRSRCRRLLLRSLPPDDVAKAAAEILGLGEAEEALRRAAALADGSVARAIALSTDQASPCTTASQRCSPACPRSIRAPCISSAMAWDGRMKVPSRRSSQQCAIGSRHGSPTSASRPAWRGWPPSGRSSTRPPPTSRCSIWSASRWFFPRSACSPSWREVKPRCLARTGRR